VAVVVADRLPAGVALRDLGLVRLRDLANPEHVYQVLHPQLRHDFPALDRWQRHRTTCRRW
jgi:class 3 adenylate cyclase